MSDPKLRETKAQSANKLTKFTLNQKQFESDNDIIVNPKLKEQKGRRQLNNNQVDHFQTLAMKI